MRILHSLTLTLAVFSLAGSAAIGFAQTEQDPSDRVQRNRQRLLELVAQEPADGSGAPPEPRSNGAGDSAAALAVPAAPPGEAPDSATIEKYLEAMRGYYNYRISGYEHRRRVFAWQLLSSRVIFVVVILLVSLGLYFAAVQFHRGRGKSPAAGEGGETTEFVASFKEIKVKSPILGVVILVISLAFFYLYLVYVYPVETIF